ncbi:MAG: hemerythrin domain-containing protein [Rikenellaceae bacterium]
MYKVGKYYPNDAMSDLICDNYPMLLVISRFGINLGFGDDSIDTVCRNNSVDTYTLLSVVNLLISPDKERFEINHEQISLPSVIQYLHNAHKYFLEYRLPQIRSKLIEAIDKNRDVSVAILNYYDEYLLEVRKHMMYEENRLFPYINDLSKGKKNSVYNVSEYSKHHDKVESKLSEFKSIIIKYYPAKTSNALNSALYDIFTCERDLASHNDIENYLLVPTIKFIEQKNSGEDE